ncbi:hypothetical protein ACIGW8_02165 [Streptomyces sioyaensis]|uniref:hypothetical protein n=1 Tax=Streptomyces sioyaensis TaxID=67364 RepID=UPI0037D08061
MPSRLSAAVHRTTATARRRTTSGPARRLGPAAVRAPHQRRTGTRSCTWPG